MSEYYCRKCGSVTEHVDVTNTYKDAKSPVHECKQCGNRKYEAFLIGYDRCMEDFGISPGEPDDNEEKGIL